MRGSGTSGAVFSGLLLGGSAWFLGGVIGWSPTGRWLATIAVFAILLVPNLIAWSRNGRELDSRIKSWIQSPDEPKKRAIYTSTLSAIFFLFVLGAMWFGAWRSLMLAGVATSGAGLCWYLANRCDCSDLWKRGFNATGTVLAGLLTNYLANATDRDYTVETTTLRLGDVISTPETRGIDELRSALDQADQIPATLSDLLQGTPPDLERKLNELDQSVQVTDLRARLAYRQGRHEEGDRLAKVAERLYLERNQERQFALQLARANSLLQRGSFVDAANAFDALRKQRPNHGILLNNLALARLRAPELLAEHGATIQLLRRAATNTEVERPVRHLISANLGYGLLQINQVAEAETVLAELLAELESAPTPTIIMAVVEGNLGVALARQSRFEPSKIHFENALKRLREAKSPDTSELLRLEANLIGVEESLGDLEGARRRLTDVVVRRAKLVPPIPAEIWVDYHNLGYMHEQAKDFAAAREAYERAIEWGTQAFSAQSLQVSFSQAYLAEVLLAQGERDRAKALASTTEQTVRALGLADTAEGSNILQAVKRVRQRTP